MTRLMEQFREAAANLRASGQRSVLALLGIVVGSASVIAMINIGRMVEEESLSQFRSLGTDMVVVSIYSWGEQPSLLLPQYEAFEAELDIFRSVAPVVQGSLSDLSYEGLPVTTTVVATTPAFFDVARLELTAGRPMSVFDGSTPFMVTGTSAFRSADGGAVAPLSPAKVVQAGSQAFHIVGVLDPAVRGAMLPLDVDSSIFVSTSTAKRITSAPTVSSVVGRLRPGVDEVVAERRIGEALRRLNPDLDFEIRLAKAELELMREQARILSLFLTMIGSIALVVGGVGVMNIMLVSVVERRREIGLRLAIGARPGDITALFFTEAMLLSVVGGLIGMVVGIGASYVTANFIGWSFFVSNSAVLLGVGVSAAVGVFFGYYPARQAARLDPVECLRSE